MPWKTSNTPLVLFWHFFLGGLTGLAVVASLYVGARVLGNLVQCGAVQACPEEHHDPGKVPGNG